MSTGLKQIILGILCCIAFRSRADTVVNYSAQVIPDVFINEMIRDSDAVYSGMFVEALPESDGRIRLNNRVFTGKWQPEILRIDDRFKGAACKQVIVKAFSSGDTTNVQSPAALPLHKRYVVFLKAMDAEKGVYRFTHKPDGGLALAPSSTNPLRRSKDPMSRLAGEFYGTATENPNEFEALQALDCLNYFTHVPVEVLVRLRGFAPKSELLQAAALATRVVHEDERAFREALKFLESETVENRARSEINEALQRSHPERHVVVILPFLKSQNENVRATVVDILTLGKTDRKTAALVVNTGLRDPSPAVQAEAFVGVQRLLSHWEKPGSSTWPAEFQPYFRSEADFESAREIFLQKYPKYK